MIKVFEMKWDEKNEFANKMAEVILDCPSGFVNIEELATYPKMEQQEDVIRKVREVLDAVGNYYQFYGLGSSASYLRGQPMMSKPEALTALMPYLKFEPEKKQHRKNNLLPLNIPSYELNCGDRVALLEKIIDKINKILIYL